MREAQRAYQKRKDNATATDKRRVDELLQVLSDLSSDVEAVLSSASKAGYMRRDDNLSSQIQRLWTSYDTAVNSACVKPELRLLQIKNDRRIAEHHSSDSFTINAPPTQVGLPIGQLGPPRDLGVEAGMPNAETSVSFNPSETNFDLLRLGETTVLQPFQQTASMNAMMKGRSIFDIVTERQAALKEAEKAASNS